MSADAAVEPDAVEPVDERWVFGGSRVDHKGRRIHAWIDESGRELLFATSGSPAIGSVYTARVVRRLDGGVTKYGSPVFSGDERVDIERRTRLTAAHRVAENELARTALERRYRSDNALDAALEPLTKIARRLPAAQRSALIAIIIERVARAW